MGVETAKGSNVTNLSDPAGYVTQISGRVVAKGSDGIERVLNLGEPVYANEIIRTIGVGTVAVEFVDGTRMDLGRETQTVIDDEVFNPEFDGDTEQIVVEVEAIQAMILAGLDPTEVAEDTAAGVSEELNDNGFGVDNDLMLDLNWQHTTPESGFETSALFSSRLPANNDELMGLVESNAELSVSLTTQTTVDNTPALTGAVNDPNATISVIVNGTQFEAINNGDGTWVLPDDSLSELEVGNTSVEVTASDIEGNTDTYTGIVTVVNDPPVASRHSDNAQEDGATITGTVPVATDAFGDLNPTGYALLSGVSEGSLTFDADGSYTFDVGTDFQDLGVGNSRDVTFSYTANDLNGGVSAPATVTITVIGTNDAPVVSTIIAVNATDDAAEFDVDLLVGSSDVDASDSLSVVGLAVTGGDTSGVNINGNSLSVDPNAYDSLAVGESEVITYNYQVIDGNGGTVTQTATITITGTNNAPTVSSAVSVSSNEDDAVFNVDLLAGAADAETSDSLSISGLTLAGGDNGGITVSGTSLSVDPNAYNSLAVGESEVVTYSYNVSDGNGGTVAQTATVTITGTNDSPTVSSAVSVSATEDDAGFSVDLLAGAGDVDASDSLSVSSLTVTAGNDSGVTVSGNSLSIDPTAYNSLAVGESEVITYSYNVTDSNGGTVAQTATITITGTNDAPTVSLAVSSSATEDDAGFSVDLLAGASDVDDSDSLSVSGLMVTGGDDSGVTVSGNSLNVDPNVYNSLAMGESEVITYTYNITDGNGGTVAQTATVIITGTNHAPTVSSAVSASATEDDAGFSVDLLAGASDVDTSDGLNVSDVAVTGGDASGVIVSGNILSVDPNAYNSLAVGESEVITYSYNVSDGNGGTVAQTATITITGTNDAPTVSSAVSASATEDDAGFSVDLLAGAGDVDASDSLSVSGLTVTAGNDSGVTVSGDSLSVDPNAYNSLAVGESEVITYTYNVIDGNGGTVAQTATITITGTNDAPTVSSAISASATEDDASFSVDLLAGASDIDISDSLGVSGLTVTGGDASGVTVGGNSLSVDPTAYNSLAVGESEVITYSYTITDGNGGSVPQTATISITGTNDAPTVAGAITTSAVEDTAVFNVNLLEGASDVDGSDTISVSGLTLTSGDAIGVTVSGNSLSVNPAVYDSLGVGETEVISYSYNVTDSSGGSVPQTATITIVGTNDGPVIDLDQNDSTVPGSGFVANYAEGASPVFIADSDINISDVDDNNIESATITISNVEAGDLLTVGALPAGIAASAYDPATGVMTLSGVASLSDYQTAIRAVQYSNDGSASGAARNIEVAIDDGNDTATASTTIGMTLVPTVAITDVSVQEPQSGTATLLFTISVDQTLASDLTFDYQTSDISALAGLDYVSDGGIAIIAAGTSSTTITVTVNSDADVFEGDETFTLDLTNFNQIVNHDAAAHLVTGGVQGIGTIGADNGAPIANDDNFITAPDTPIITGNVLTNDALVDNAVVNSYQSTSTGGGAVVYNNDGTFSYAPASGFTGTDTFTYQLIDADGQIDTATVTIDVTDAVVNAPLVSSVPDSSYVENGSPVNLMSGISLADVDSTTFSSVVVRIEGYVGSQDVISYLTAGTSVNASVSVTGNIWELTLSDAADINEYRTVLNTLTYENSSENPSTAARAVTLEAYDSAYSNIYGSDTGTLMITPVNDAPIVIDNDVYTLESTNDNALNISAPTDYDNDDTLLTITVTGVPTSNGTVMMADGVTPLSVGQTLTLTELTSLVFDSTSIEGAEAFTYTVSDGSSTVVGTTTIDVGTTNVDVNTVYESGLPSGTESDSGLSMATGNLLANDAMSPGSIDSIDFGVGTYTPVSGVITVTTPLGTLTVYADNSMPGHSVGDYEYVLNSQDGSGNDVIETFTYNFTSGLPYSDTLSITIIDDQPVANDTIEDIPESEEQVFNVILTLDISTSMNAQVGTTGQTRLELAREALTALGREYFNQSSQVNVTVLLFADGAHTLGTYSDFTDLEAAIAGIRDAGTSPAYTNNSPNDPDTYLSNSTSYNDALSLIEEEFTADLASQNPADNVQNISYFLSDGAITSNGSPIGNGFDTFVNSNSINSYSAGIGTGLPSNLSDLNFVHNIDSLGQGNGAVDNALIISDVSLLEAELLSTVPTAFGGNITLDGTVANVLFGADGGFVESITLDIGTFTYDGSIVTVPTALAATVEVDGSRLTLGADDGFTYGTFTFDFSDGNYLFTAPNGTAPNTFAINYTIRDADGDTASAVATVNIVDDRPEARDDLDTIQHFEVADGNVISGLGTDAGPKLGAGFTPFAAQGGGVDKIVDNADITSFDYKGITFDLDFVSLPVNGSSGDLQWTFNSETDIDGVLVTQVTVTDNGDNSVLVFRSNGYYSYTPQEAADAPNPQTIITTSAPSYAADGLILNSPHGNIRYRSGGAGIEGGGSNSRVDYQETLVMTFDTVTMPLGVTDVSLGLTSWDSGETVLIDIFDTMGAAIAGNLLFDSSTIDLSGYSGIGRIEMTGASPTDPTNVRLYSVDYTEIIAATDTMLEPVTIDYVLTDSDGQSDSAQLTIYVTDNTINGTDGADNIFGHAENDAIFGDAGDDILSGNDGHDTIAGGAGADSLFGGTGQDTLSGGDDNDVLYGNDGNDHLAGDAGDDIVDGGTGDDIVQGGDGDDLVFGGGGDDYLEGGAGNDALYGGAGYDIIVGDEGDDVIFGGAGDDLLSGGKDRDTFIWQVGDEGEIADPGVDIITDFDDTEGRDVLDLSDLLQDEENNSLTDYLQFQLTDTDGDGDSETQISIDVDGGSSFETTQQIILDGVDLTVGGTLSDQEIINTLLIKATIVTD
jgi:VCBS repeat-containing protein